MQSYTGCDLACVITIPKLDIVIEWATLQTITISSTRSVGQVRGLGSSAPIGITRGARTYAGSLVFAVVDHTALAEAAKRWRAYLEKNPSQLAYNTDSSFHPDILPPFTIVIQGATEQTSNAPAMLRPGQTGVVSGFSQVLHDVVLTHYGTTYSVQDLMTEETFSYIASSATPALQETSIVVHSNFSPTEWAESRYINEDPSRNLA
jgi:hypothetical protein